MRTVPLLRALGLLGPLLAAAVAEADADTVALGGLAISYDPARFDVSNVSPAGQSDQVVQFACREPDCRGRPLISAISRPVTSSSAQACLDISAEVGTRSPLTAARVTTQMIAGLTVYRWTEVSNCRARSPVRRSACLQVGETVYSFGSGISAGCGGVEGAPSGVFDELLAGISVRPANVP